MFTVGMTPGNWEPVIERIFTLNHIKYEKRIHNHLAEVRVRGSTHVRSLCDLICPYVVIKKPIVERMRNFRGVTQWGGKYHIPLNELDIIRIADDVDFVRAFNRKRNIPYVWDGNRICEIYNVQREKKARVPEFG